MVAARERFQQLIGAPLHHAREVMGNKWGSRERSARWLFDNARELLESRGTESLGFARSRRHIDNGRNVSIQMESDEVQTTVTVKTTHWLEPLARRRETTITVTNHSVDGISVAGAQLHFTGHRPEKPRSFVPTYLDIHRCNRVLRSYINWLHKQKST